MPTNEERREIAQKIRELTEDVWSLAREWEEEGIFTNCQDQADYYQIHSAIFGTLPADHMHPCDYNELHERLADLIEPDYTSEESGYFILPKPKDPLVCRCSSVDGSVYDIINENAREWQRQIKEEIQQRLFETFRKTCHDTDHMGDAIKCSKCGEITRETLYWVDVGEDGKTVKSRMPLFCARCGAKVMDDANL